MTNEVSEFLNLKDLANELAGNLSGGQKKLLELGRTMMVDAKIVLLDEVGAGVNRTLLKELGTAILKLNKERDKLKRSLGGIAEMKKVPEMIFIIDTNVESLAVKEAISISCSCPSPTANPPIA